MVFPSKWDGNGMGWDGNLYFCPTTSYRPITITRFSDTSTIPYHLPQLLPSHPTHHDKTSYHPNTIPSVSDLSHVHTNTIVYHPKPSIRSLLRDVPLLPSGNPFKCHEEVLYLQPMIPPKHFYIFRPDWGVLRRSRYVQVFL